MRLTSLLAARYVLKMFRRCQTKAGMHSAIALVMLYGWLLNGLFAAATPIAYSPPMDGIICTHDGAGSDSPAAPIHDGICCVAACSVTASAFVPADNFDVLPWPPALVPLVHWSMAEGMAHQPRLNSRASPRGPPAVI
jgi:hypothetical protein